MKAQIIKEFGGPTVFHLTDIRIPDLLPGSVLIKVMATSVNPIDTKVRSGAVPAVSPTFPAVLHGDVSGIVYEVGADVTEFHIGDEVYGCAGGFKGTSGALAEFMLCDARLLSHKPKNLSFAEAAAIPLVSITAWEALFDRAQLKKGENILIHGGTGGVGHIGIQLAKWAGAKVYTTVSSSIKMSIAKDLGADVGINYRETSVQEYVNKYTNGEGFQTVFDTVGGKNLDRSFQAAALNGKVVSIAARSTHDLTPLHSKGLSFHVVFMLLNIINEERRSKNADTLKKISSLIEKGKLKPLIDSKQFTFEEIAEAHQYLEEGKAIGKVILVNNWI